MAINQGELVRFDRDSKNRWSASHVLDLGAAPETFTTISGDTLLVVVTGALLTVKAPSHVQVIYRNNVWRYTYATSVVRDRVGIVYIGMRSAVARLTPRSSGYREDWLVKAECPQRRKVSDVGECACISGRH
jgi:hypothetical protein